MTDENSSSQSSSLNEPKKPRVDFSDKLISFIALLSSQMKVFKFGKESILRQRANSQSSVENIFNLNKNQVKSHIYEAIEMIARIFFVILFLYFYIDNLLLLIPVLISYIISIFVLGEDININIIFQENFQIGDFIVFPIISILIIIGLSLCLKDDRSIYNKITKVLLPISIFSLIAIIILNTMVYSIKENYLQSYLVLAISSQVISVFVALVLVLILIFFPISLFSLLEKHMQEVIFKFEITILSYVLKPLGILPLIALTTGCSLVALDQKPVGPLELIVSSEDFENVKEIQQNREIEKSDKNKEMWSCYFNKLVSDPTSAPKCFEEEDEGISSQKVNTHEIEYISKNFEDTILTPEQFKDDSFIFKYKVDDEMIIDNYVCYFYFKNSDNKKKISYYNASESNWMVGNRNVSNSNTFFVSDKYIMKEIFCDNLEEELKVEIGKSKKDILDVYFGVDLYVSSKISYILDIPFININEKQYVSRDLALTDLLSNDDNLNQLYNIKNSWTNILNTKVVNLREKFPIILSQKDSQILVNDLNILLVYSDNHNPIGKLLNIEFSEDTKELLILPTYFNLIGNPEITSDGKGVIFNVKVKNPSANEKREVIIETLRVDSKATFLVENNEFNIKIRNNNLKSSENEIEVVEISELLFTKNCKYTKKINRVDELENEFLEGVQDLANKYGVSRDDFLTIFSLETIKTFSPCILNRNNYAIGLIQFTERTLEDDIKVSFDEISLMTRVEQLEYVDKYLSKYKSDIKDLSSLYLAVFLPSIIDESSNEDFVIPQKYYKQNIPLDKNQNGEIKVSEINYYLEEHKVS